MNNSLKTRKLGNTRELKLETRPERLAFPYSAIVGQEEMKLALVLNVVSSSVGGVLMMGHRGTGKSTVVRALADLLPEISGVSGCFYRCDPADEQNLCASCLENVRSGGKLRRSTSPVPVVDLPLGATEDRVCGTIDIEQALQTGSRRFEPGLLARANRGFLYIDEVNLLEDHLVDLLLDVAQTGVNKVERESISVEHPARFVLIGSGNPEEGELRPQLLDRFGIYVDVKTEEDLDRRVEIMERREAFERDPDSFRTRFADEQEQWRRKIERARKSFPRVTIERNLLRNIARLCSDLKVDGHRGELTITRAARALAALEGRKKVTDDHVRQVAAMSLRHRLRRDLLEETPSAERIEEALDRVFSRGDQGEGEDGDGQTSQSPRSGGGRQRPGSATTEAGRQPATTPNGSLSQSPNGGLGRDSTSEVPSAPPVAGSLPKLGSGVAKISRSKSKPGWQSSRDSRAKRAAYTSERGRYSRSVSSKSLSSRLALDATLRAAVGSGFRVNSTGNQSLLAVDARQVIPTSAFRFKLFKQKQGRLFIFGIDLSGSMALNRISHAKGVMHTLLRQAYIKRDTVAIVGFRGTGAELLLAPSRSRLRARRVLDSVGVGGGTPLSAGLACAFELAKRVGLKAGEVSLIVFTDGQANVPLRLRNAVDRTERQRQIDVEIGELGARLKQAEVTTTVIATQDRYRSNYAAESVAAKLGAQCSWTFV
ncbi:MAG TPA: magnesium chelatase ATPase subunit I [Pyrinomonadaceae bacterium]|nr:magnesium chelatase ATPase subunit I [Pyrinomonadaceae bacterium]